VFFALPHTFPGRTGKRGKDPGISEKGTSSLLIPETEREKRDDAGTSQSWMSMPLFLGAFMEKRENIKGN